MNLRVNHAYSYFLAWSLARAEPSLRAKPKPLWPFCKELGSESRRGARSRREGKAPAGAGTARVQGTGQVRLLPSARQGTRGCLMTAQRECLVPCSLPPSPTTLQQLRLETDSCTESRCGRHSLPGKPSGSQHQRQAPAWDTAQQDVLD